MWGRFRALHDYVRSLDWPALVGSALVFLFLIAVAVPALRTLGHNPHQQSSASEAPKERPRKSSDDRLAEYTLWLMIFTGVLAAGTLALWYVTHKTLRHAERTSQRELRAYVMVESVRIENAVPGRAPNAVVNVRNFGRTPAHHFSHASMLGCQPFPLTESPPLVKEETDPEHPMAPSATQILAPRFSTPLSVADYRAVETGTHALYVVGEMHYTDAFGDEHITRFCLFSGGGQTEIGAVAAYHTGNDAN